MYKSVFFERTVSRLKLTSIDALLHYHIKRAFTICSVEGATFVHVRPMPEVIHEAADRRLTIQGSHDQSKGMYNSLDNCRL